MHNIPVQCATPNCPNMSSHMHCLICSAREASERLMLAKQGTCAHGHSITGDFGMIQRLLPEYHGGHPQRGYMLDICKVCFKELAERPYSMTRSRQRT